MPVTKPTTMEAVLIAMARQLAAVKPPVPDSDFLNPQEELLHELSLAHSTALLCDYDDACDAESDIREAIKLLEAELSYKVPTQIARSRFTRGMDYGDRLSSINDLIMSLEECNDRAADAGCDGTDISGYIVSALETANESRVYLEEMLADEEQEELRYATSAYYRAAI